MFNTNEQLVGRVEVCESVTKWLRERVVLYWPGCGSAGALALAGARKGLSRQPTGPHMTTKTRAYARQSGRQLTMRLV